MFAYLVDIESTNLMLERDNQEQFRTGAEMHLTLIYSRYTKDKNIESNPSCNCRRICQTDSSMRS